MTFEHGRQMEELQRSWKNVKQCPAVQQLNALKTETKISLEIHFHFRDL